jgi:glucosamine 6-phosphate synthetase-like amidotransferase/phosphosugar isomerase protein
MCGIIGIICKNYEAHKYLIQGIEILQNRGYDSAGIYKKFRYCYFHGQL